MHTDDMPPPARSRAILCHYDSYSAALHFACWPDRSLMWPAPLPEGAARTDSLLEDGPDDGPALRQALLARITLADDDLVLVDEYDQGLSAPDGDVRVHLLRCMTFEVPHQAIEALGGEFKPISGLRGRAATELALVREVFHLLVGGGGRA